MAVGQSANDHALALTMNIELLYYLLLISDKIVVRQTPLKNSLSRLMVNILGKDENT